MSGSVFEFRSWAVLVSQAKKSLAYHLKNQFSLTFYFQALSGLVKNWAKGFLGLWAYVLQAHHWARALAHSSCIAQYLRALAKVSAWTRQSLLIIWNIKSSQLRASMKKFTPSQVLSPGPRFEPRLVPPQWDPKLKSNKQRNFTLSWNLILQVCRLFLCST